MLNPMSDRRLKTKFYQKQCFFVAVAGGLLIVLTPKPQVNHNIYKLLCFLEVYIKEPALIYQLSLKGTFSCHPPETKFPMKRI